jgi:hypothetical protein
MKTPQNILDRFESASEGLDFGDVTLRLSIKLGKPRYVIAKEESFIPIDETSVTADSYSKETGPIIPAMNKKA